MICLLCILSFWISSLTNAATASSQTQMLRGDADGNDRIDIRDVTCIQRVISEIETISPLRQTAADVNRDSVTDINDATLIQRYLAEYENDYRIGRFPAESPPAYWQNEVNDTVGKIKAIQTQHSQNLICFGWCSDIHIPANGTVYEKRLGTVAAKVMDDCNIPLFLMSGDMLTGDTGTSLEQIPSAYEKAWEYLSPIDTNRILAIKGNHDAWTGNNGHGVYYVKGLPPERVNELLFQPQWQDTRRVFGKDGSYFYLDNKEQKTRYICLNSHWAHYEENPDGTATYTTQKIGGFGQEQLDWLIEDALNVDSGYSVIITVHVPPTDKTISYYNNSIREYYIFRGIITAFCNKTSYQGTYTHSSKGQYLQEGTWADVSVSCDFSSYHGNLLSIFCGHDHCDQIITNDLPVPIVCITSAINTPYDAEWSSREAGTSNETAIDFVCIDTSTGQIELIRCGYGNDRSYTPPT